MRQFCLLSRCISLLLLLPDTCLLQETQPWVVHTNRKTIQRLEIDTLNNRTIVSGLKGAIAVDYHFSQSYVYWTDQTADRISRASFANTEVKEDIIKYTPGRADGIAVDWVYDHVYWIDAEHKHVKVSRLDGTLRKTLINKDLVYPRAIIVHPTTGFLFFTDVLNPRILRCALDGSDIRVIVSNKTTDLKEPNGLSIDFSSNRVYWVDNVLKQIRHSDFQGADVRTLKISATYMPYAWGLALFDNWIYWTSFNNNTIYRVDKYTATKYEVVKTGLDQPVGIKIYSKEIQPEGINLCGQHNGGCQQLCFFHFQNGISCACADGFQLQSDGISCLNTGFREWLTFANEASIERLDVDTTVTEIIVSNITSAGDLDIHYNKGLIYWVDATENKILRTRVNTDSFSGLSEVVVNDNTGTLNGIAVDWIYDLLFWTDSGQGLIQVAHLDGTSKKTIVKDLKEPRAIVVDPATRWLFFSMFGTKPKIQRCRSDGKDRTTIIQDDISQPYGMSVDSTDGRLYWIDADLNQIKSTKFDGSGTYTVIKDRNVLPRPFDLVVFDKYVYWTNWQYRSILRANKYTGKEITVVARNVYLPMGIQMFGKGAQMTGRNSSDDFSKNTGFSSNVIVWYSSIGGGCAVFVIIVFVVIFLCVKRFRKMKEQRESKTSHEAQENNYITSVYETVNEEQMFDKSEGQKSTGGCANTTSSQYLQLSVSNSQIDEKSVYERLNQTDLKPVKKPNDIQNLN